MDKKKKRQTDKMDIKKTANKKRRQRDQYRTDS